MAMHIVKDKTRELSRLDPHMGNGRLRFECPACPKPHWVSIAISPHAETRKDEHVWESFGSLQFLTVTPSIDGTDHGCKFHGWIKNGIVNW